MEHSFSKTETALTWIMQAIAAVIMFQTLFYKFSGAEESIYIFTTVGMEPWGRYGSGVVELISAVLLLIPRTAWLGALIGAGTMAGAIFFHLTILGPVVKGDGGQLFAYALITFFFCLGVLWIRRREIFYIKRFFLL
ncbi:MAG: DoxX family protein [Cytophagaceae bacterium]